jgi:small-conductance mechanosensitive channel
VDLDLQSLFADVLGRLSGNQGISSLIVVLTAIALRYGVGRYISGRVEITGEQRRRLRANLRNALFLAAVVALVVIWAPALRTFVLSIAAFTVAIILATKELILCLSGSMVAAAGKALKIGSWIEVGAIRGEVVDHTVLTTTLQELGRDANAYAFTGRTVVLPNSVYLTTPITNERFHKRFVYHTVPLVMDAAVDPAPVARAMQEAMAEARADGAERARRYLGAIEARADVAMPPPDPQSRVAVLADGKVKVTVTAFVPAHEAGRIERATVEAGLAALRARHREMAAG